MFIFQIDPSKVLAVKNDKGISQTVQDPESILKPMLANLVDKSNQAEAITPDYPNPEKEGIKKTLIFAMIRAAGQGPHLGLREFSLQEIIGWTEKYTGQEVTKEREQALGEFFNALKEQKPDVQSHPEEFFNALTETWNNGKFEGLPESTVARSQGDLNGDGTINNDDLTALKDGLTTGDLNGDGKLDVVDEQFLKNIIDGKPNYEPLVYRPNRGNGDLNHDGKVDQKDLYILGNVLKAGDMDSDGKVDKTDVELLANQIGMPPINPLQSSLGDVIDSIIKNNGDFTKVDLSSLVKALAEETGIPADDNRTVMLQEFFMFTAFPPSGIPKPKPPLNIEGLKNMKLEDVIKFWKDPKIAYPV